MQQPEGFPTNYEALKKSAPQEGIKQHTFRTRDGEGQAVNFQVLDLGLQLCIWASSHSDMNNLTLAMPPARTGLSIAATVLLPGSDSEAAEGVARRLAAKLHRPVAVSWNLVEGDLLSRWAEKQLVTELLRIEADSKDSTPSVG